MHYYCNIFVDDIVCVIFVCVSLVYFITAIVRNNKQVNKAIAFRKHI